MSNKLQNIKAIKQMMAGEHKTQQRTSHYFKSTKTEIPEEDILERFEDGKPKVWIETDIKGIRTKITQHDGFKSREPELSILKNIRKILSVPKECPECGTEMRNHEKRLNFKFWFMRKKCFGCVLEDERKIKIQGPDAWKKYENEIIKNNIEGWIKDADKEVEILKTQIKETVWGNADGDFGEVDVTSFIERMEKDYEELKDNIRSIEDK
tara:strand:- start:1831 stop:2460 length:630 start_codon:yes stop_codon:yes gene_type:complete